MSELTVLDPSETDVDPAAAPQKVRLFLIDGSGYIFRAYHALPRLTRKSDGAPVGAVAGFCNMLWKLICDTRSGEVPTHLAVIFDASEKTFRNTLVPSVQGAPAAGAGGPGSPVRPGARGDAGLRSSGGL